MPKKTKQDMRPGDTIKVYQKIHTQASTDKKEKTQVFEGLLIAKKHGSEPGATITVRKEVSGVGVEKIFPIHSPLIEKIEVVKRGKVRRAKLYYLRKAKGQRAKIKERQRQV